MTSLFMKMDRFVLYISKNINVVKDTAQKSFVSFLFEGELKNLELVVKNNIINKRSS